jgi:biopolymer transport protein ExbB
MVEIVETWEQVRGFLELGGSVLLVIAAVTLLMWTLIIERLVYFRWGHRKDAERVLAGWRARVDHTSWYAHKIQAEERSRLSQKLQRSLPTIKTLVALCPLLGLLGTVIGMIEVFDIMAMVGSANTRAMASGVSMATIPTMAGMTVALSGIYFASRLDRKAREQSGKLEEALNQEGGEPCAVAG